MFNELQENLQNIFKGLSGSQITEDNIEGAIREVKRALINSDVSLKAIKTFTSRVREKAIGQKVISGVSPQEQFIKIINDELIYLLGGDCTHRDVADRADRDIADRDVADRDVADRDVACNVSTGMVVILMLGLQGAGKTTTCAKLAKYLKDKKEKNPLLVPLDLKRPAAIEQLEILGKQINIPVFPIDIARDDREDVASNVETLDVAKSAINYAKENNFNVVILDSAGRLQLDNDLMAELLLVEKFTKPQEKLLVIDSMIGQEAANVASSFHTQIGVTGIILTKLDGDSRGGAALSIVEEIKMPIKLVGVGEKIEDLQEFFPERIASRILGMGDILTLVEKAQEKIEEKEALELERKMLEGEFNFETFLQAQNMTSKLGNFSNMFEMMGMGGLLNKMGMNLNKADQEKMLSQGESKMKKFKVAIQSMTKKERLNPNLINMSRRIRIAKGCGQKEKDIDLLMKEFSQMKKIMGNMKPLMNLMKGNNNPDLSSLLPQATMQGGNRAQRRLSKSFKPKK